MTSMNSQSNRLFIRPELELILCCSRTHLDPTVTERIKHLLSQNIDWDYVLRLTMSQKIWPLVYKSLNVVSPQAVPKDVLNILFKHALSTKERNAFLTKEFEDIFGLLRESRIPSIPFKGLAVALGVYGGLSLRRFIDLDILIRGRDVPAAKNLLLDIGFSTHETAPLDGSQEISYIQANMSTELEFQREKEEGWVTIDLHWGISGYHFPVQLDFDFFSDRLEPVQIADKSVLCPCHEDILLYLCVNGHKDRWTPLRHLCDINELIRLLQGDGLERVIERANRWNFKRMVVYPLLLTNYLFGAPLPKYLVKRLEADPISKNFARLSCDKIIINIGKKLTGVPHRLTKEKNNGSNMLFDPIQEQVHWESIGYDLQMDNQFPTNSETAEIRTRYNEDLNFVGRDWLKEKVRLFLSSHNSGYFALIMEPGMGKTAFVTNQVQVSNNDPVFNLVRKNGQTWDNPDAILRSLISQLRQKYSIPHINRGEGSQPSDEFRALLEIISSRLTDGKKEVIYIDGLDEVFGPKSRFSGISLSGYLPTQFPRGIVIVLTSEDFFELRTFLSQTNSEVQKPDPLSIENINDIRSYLHQQNKNRNLGIDDKLINSLAVATNGSFLAAVSYLRDRPNLKEELKIWKDMIAYLIPIGLKGSLSKSWNWIIESTKTAGISPQLLKDVLAILSIAREPLSVDAIALFLIQQIPKYSMSSQKKEDITRQIYNVLRLSHEVLRQVSKKKDKEAYYCFFHHAYAAYFEAQFTKQEKKAYHRMICKECSIWNEKKTIRNYALSHRLDHLIAGEQWEELVDTYGQLEFIIESAKKYGFSGIYSSALVASQDSRVPKKLKKPFRAWERFLRWRLELLKTNPELYSQEVINEFVPTEGWPFGKSWNNFGNSSKKSSDFRLRKTSGLPSIEATNHKGPISSMAFSSNGRLVATGSFDSTVKIWDTTSGQLISSCIPDNWEPIYRVIFSRDANYVAAQGTAGVKVWDTISGRMVTNCGMLSRSEINLAYSQDGRLIAAGGKDRVINICDAKTGQILGECLGHVAPINGLVFSHDTTFLVSVSCDTTVKIWKSENAELVSSCEGHKERVNCVACSPDGRFLASGDNQSTILIWDLHTGKFLYTCNGHKDSILSITFSQDSRFVVSGSNDRTVKIWDASTGHLKASCLHYKGVLCVAASDKYVVSGERDNVANIWELESGKLVAECKGHKDLVFNVSCSDDGKKIATVSIDNTVRIWDCPSGRFLTECVKPMKSISRVCISDDGSLTAVADSERVLKVNQVGDGKEIAAFSRGKGVAYGLAISPDSKLIASAGNDKAVRVIEIETGKLISEFQGHKDWVFDVDFSPDGRLICSGGWDKTVNIWEVMTAKPVIDCTGYKDIVQTVEFSPDGKIIASGLRNGLLCLREARTGNLITEYGSHSSQINDIAFSADGRFIASASNDKIINIWERKSGLLIAKCEGHKDDVNSISFLYNGKFLASGSKDKTVRIWEKNTEKCVNVVPFSRPVSMVTVISNSSHIYNIVIVDEEARMFQYEVIVTRLL